MVIGGAPGHAAQDRELIWRQAKIDQLTHELSLHKRWRFGVKTERLPVAQAQLFEEAVEADLTAFSVERHIRGKWVCHACETLVQAPVPAHVIDKGLPTAGLLAQVLVAKYQDHLPCTARKASSAGRGSRFPNPRSPSGSARWACSCNHWWMR